VASCKPGRRLCLSLTLILFALVGTGATHAQNSNATIFAVR
jgi:hypothetical protein